MGTSPRRAGCSGVSRYTYYQWLAKAEQYGLSALLPKERRRPHQPNAMSSEEVSIILAEAVARPTLGPRSLLRHLKARGVDRSASGVAKVLRRHNLGTARRRVAALASLTAADSGQVTDAALEGPFGFCLYAATPGQVVALDTFYVGGSRASARSGSSPPWTSRPGSRSSSWSSGTRAPPSQPASSIT